MENTPLDIRFFAYYDQKRTFAVPCHTFSEPVLFCLQNGQFRYRIGNCDWLTAEENAIVLCPANTPFYGEIITPSSFAMAKFSANTDFPKVVQPIYPEAARVQENLKCLRQSGFALTHQPNEEIRHYVKDLYYMALSALPREKLPLQDAYDDICSHFCEDISINDLAKQYGYTAPRLIALFNKHYGAPPKNIILRQRIMKAQGLLLQTELSVGEISLACGYEDTLYFSRIFSKYCGCSPSQFRKENTL